MVFIRRNNDHIYVNTHTLPMKLAMKQIWFLGESSVFRAL